LDGAQLQVTESRNCDNVVWELFTDVLEEFSVSIFRVEEKAGT
jgi:hypothetical protein